MGHRCVKPLRIHSDDLFPCFFSESFGSGYLASCRSIVTCAKKIEAAITTEIPELYVLGKPPASVVAFGSNMQSVNVLRVGDAMSARGWHLNGLRDPPAVHIACTVSNYFVQTSVYNDLDCSSQRLTVPVVDQFIADLKDCVREAKTKPSETGRMVTVYGTYCQSAATCHFERHFSRHRFGSLKCSGACLCITSCIHVHGCAVCGLRCSSLRTVSANIRSFSQVI